MIGLTSEILHGISNIKEERMTPMLYEWLRKMFYKDNYPKYRHLFERWIQNLTWNQILGFEKQMYNYKNKIL